MDSEFTAKTETLGSVHTGNGRNRKTMRLVCYYFSADTIEIAHCPFVSDVVVFAVVITESEQPLSCVQIEQKQKRKFL